MYHKKMGREHDKIISILKYELMANFHFFRPYLLACIFFQEKKSNKHYSFYTALSLPHSVEPNVEECGAE